MHEHFESIQFKFKSVSQSFTLLHDSPYVFKLDELAIKFDSKQIGIVFFKEIINEQTTNKTIPNFIYFT